MPYINWNEKFDNEIKAGFIELCDVLKLIRQIKYFFENNIDDKYEERLLNELSSFFASTKDVKHFDGLMERFPADAFYVHTGDGQFSISLREMENTFVEWRAQCKLVRPDGCTEDADEAEFQLWKNILKLDAMALSKGNAALGVFDRETFENVYDLKWNDADADSLQAN